MIQAMCIALQAEYANGQCHPSWTAVQTFAYASRQAALCTDCQAGY